jgi:general secretion pathway protein K
MLRRQTGAAIILAMLTLALMAEIAALVVTDYGAAAELLVGRQDQEQSRWLARGAVDWARNVLAQDKKTSLNDHLGEAWATRVAPTQVEDGEVSGEITDYSGRFDLNSLVTGGIVDTGQRDAYKQLLTLLGLPPQQAAGLSAALVDWLDANSVTEQYGAETDWYVAQGKGYRAANGLLVDVDELRLIRGYDDSVMDRIRPFVAAFPAAAPLNANTASPEVLSATISGLGIDDARVLVARRQAAAFGKASDFTDQLSPKAVKPATGRVDVTSRYFLVGGRAKYGQAVTRMQVLLDRKDVWPTIVWQKVL